MMQIADLWVSADPKAWNDALESYWTFVQPPNVALEQSLEATALARMNPEDLTIRDGAMIVGILQRKAAANNRNFKSNAWTPRKLDKVLWTYGR